MADAYDHDRAPIVMRATRLRMGAALLLMVVLPAFGLRQLSGAPDWAQKLALVFFTGLIGLMVAQVFKPPTLTLSSEGLAWGALLRTRRWTWSQIGDFRRASIGIGFDYVDGRFELLRRLNGVSCILLPFGTYRQTSLWIYWSVPARVGREARMDRHSSECWRALKPMVRFELGLRTSSRTSAQRSPRSGGPQGRP